MHPAGPDLPQAFFFFTFFVTSLSYYYLFFFSPICITYVITIDIVKWQCKFIYKI